MSTRRGSGVRLWDATPLTRITLVFALLLSVWPLYWMVVIASRSVSDATAMPPPLLPGGNLGDNISRALTDDSANLMTGLLNSFIVAGTVTVSVVVISTMAGFAFAKLRFRGRQVLLVSVLLTMMVPLQHVGVVPLYIMMIELNWTNTMQAVILPFLVNGFGIFLMRQYTMQAVPDELIEAARMDGAATWKIYLRVVLPAVRPGMAVLALLTFMQNWNEFLWPLMILRPDNPTVQVAIRGLSNTNYGTDYSMIFTGTLLSIVPLVIIFIAFGRQIVGGLMEGAVKS
ncbi:cellobiose transport system permease protein [Stackebrandtia endophytica]|uniref:Cellobiose transport system permease protein n=1 Tax=Stackebrandtia endophytica TaxID=1496996 RepID=A0A543AXA3_9ACTN|nr:carbohydrate ABC transporter permease [Stackebrandtia endophytica]TQL77206.1 cellobiose transport system permease protein [Stackebrandtia endophytica]